MIAVPGFTKLAGVRTGIALLQRASCVMGAEMVNRITRIVTAVALARTMGIAEFGIAMAALTVHELVRMFIQNGLGTRIVTARDDELAQTAQAVHRLNWSLGLVLCAVQLLVAWPIAMHFASDDLAWAIALLACVHVIYPFAMVRVYLAQRHDRWGVVSFAMGAQAATDNVLTAVLAVLGFGIWSVVIPKFIVAIGWVLFHRRMTNWSPSQVVGKLSYAKLLKYAGNVLGVELLSTLRMHGDKAIVGLFLGPAALGLYSFATNIGRGITLSLSQGLSLVVLPYLCRSRANGRLQRSHAETLAVMTLAVAPLAILQVLHADWLVPLLFGAQWAPASELIAIIALASISHPVISATSQMLRADNRVHEDLRLSVLFSLSYLAALIIAVPHGLMTTVIATAAVQIIAALLIAIYSFCCIGQHQEIDPIKETA